MFDATFSPRSRRRLIGRPLQLRIIMPVTRGFPRVFSTFSNNRHKSSLTGTFTATACMFVNKTRVLKDDLFTAASFSFWQQITQLFSFCDSVQVATRHHPFTVTIQPVTFPVLRKRKITNTSLSE